MAESREVLSVEDYAAEVLALVEPLPAETCPTSEALGRTLAEPVTSRGAIPAFANSAMDGYAVRWADLTGTATTLTVLGDVPAGSAADPAIGPGQCVRIMTGAPVPTAADTVVPVELTDGGTTTVTVHDTPAQGRGAHIRGAGEDIARGEVVLSAGSVLTPAALAAVAAAGRAEVAVTRRPVIGLASTGDELVAPGAELARGQIYESNSLHLAATITAHGGVPRLLPSIGDELDAFVTALDGLAGEVDLVVLTGGVSVGAYDIARIALGEHADATFRHVLMQPGKPQGWARWRGRTPVLALPGNPSSAAISFEVFGRPLLERMLARSAGARIGAAVATTSWRSPAGRRQHVPVTLTTDATGTVLATPTHTRGSASHLVTSLAGADALAVVAEDTSAVEVGDVLTTRSLT